MSINGIVLLITVVFLVVCFIGFGFCIFWMCRSMDNVYKAYLDKDL